MKRFLTGANEITRRDLLRFGGFGLLSVGLTGVSRPGLLPAIETPLAKCGPAVEMPIYLPRNGAAAGKAFANTPNWAREAPGLFAPLETSDAGAGLLWFPNRADAPSYILTNFSGPMIQRLIADANSIGVNLIYLTAWCDGKMGDYSPKVGLRDLIAAVHKAGGHVILRIEGLTANIDSQVGRKHGAEWSILGTNQKPITKPYPDKYKMCPATEGWAKYLEYIAGGIVDLGADGIYFDSWGDPRVFACHSTRHGHASGDEQAYNKWPDRYRQTGSRSPGGGQTKRSNYLNRGYG